MTNDTNATQPAFTPSHSDADLVNQPIGYWSTAAGQAVVHHIRTMLAEEGLTQPQWWILNQVPAEGPRERAAVVDVLRGYLEFGEGGIEHNVDALLRRKLLTEETADGVRKLARTEAGHELQQRVAARQRQTRQEIHEGIDDAEYVRALKVLQRMIHNVNGSAWHH
ncbi:MarR family winged helix-turn-helix transcriptional regulator [Streptomyces sp. NRRL B-1347]|uniref:MarR family winged helix-turn-helix transcriptional regulator n=1 Tax=Streptomyces sp. NRRL B-1347 TaxID=1476877 RepID=UPI00068F1BE6|nr:MarR family winged helix-turn-helix transcriptional regulator [Streptomyces sp. NRRL B-1347]